MTSDDAWRVAQGLQGRTLQRWTKDGEGGLPFTFEIRDSGRGPSIAFFRDGREVKQASYDRFCRFWGEWKGGQHAANWFTNDGVKKSQAQVARFLVPVFELVRQQL